MKITNIAKNTSYYTLALVMQKIISFSFFIILARNLIPVDLGKYYLAISFTTIFAVFIDLGLANVLTREVARLRPARQDFGGQAKTRHGAQELLGNVLAIKIPLAIFSLIAVVVLINVMGYSALTRQLVYLSSICMILDSFTLIFFACIRGWHNLTFESISAVIFQLIILSLGFIVLRLNLGLKWLMGALIMASAFNFCYATILIRYKWKIKLWPRVETKLIKAIIKITIPFGIFGILQRLYVYLDTVLLSVLAGDKFVGLYQIAFKIVFALQFLPMAFMASLYPAFAAYWAKNREQLAITFERAMSYLIIISLPISIGIIVLADKIILLFKPEYLSAVLPLQIIMASLLFLFLNFPIGSLLNACDKQKINTMNMGITVGVSVILNLILIPKFQTVGASITVVATNFLMFVLGMCWVPQIIKYQPKKIVLIALKALMAVAVMAAAVLILKSILDIFVVIIIAGIIYFAILLALGGVKKADIASILNSFHGNIKKSS